MGNLIKLNLGGFKGKEHFPAGWSMVDSADAADVNVDLAEQPLPFEDNFVDAVYRKSQNAPPLVGGDE